MPTVIDQLYREPLNQAAPAQWIQPDLIVLDDLTGPETLRILAARFGGGFEIHNPERVIVASSLDVESAWEDRRREHEAMRAFADAYSIRFYHDPGTCREGCPPTLDPPPDSVVISAGAPMSRVAGSGGLSVSVAPEDLAAALTTGVFWFRRPPIRRVRVLGSFTAGATAHDLAILLRPRIEEGAWLVIEWDRADVRAAAAPALASLLLRESRAEYVTCLSSAAARVRNRAGEAEIVDLDRLGPMIGVEGNRAESWSAAPPDSIDRVYIGSCTTGSVDDLRLAAAILYQHAVAAPTVIAPATERDLELLSLTRLDESDVLSPTLIDVFQAAGCDIGHPGCAGCVNALADAFADGGAPERELRIVATAVASVTTRRVARVFTASPITAAHCAISGALGAPTRQSRVEIGI